MTNISYQSCTSATWFTSSYTAVVTQDLGHRSCCTEVLTQKSPLGRAWTGFQGAWRGLQKGLKEACGAWDGFKGASRGLEKGFRGAWRWLAWRWLAWRWLAWRGVQGGFKGASRGLETGFKWASPLWSLQGLEGGFKGAKGLQGGFKGLEKGLKGASRWRGLQGGLRRASRGLQKGLRRCGSDPAPPTLEFETLFHPIIFLFCCNFPYPWGLEACPEAVPLRQLRPKVLGRQHSHQLLQVQPCWDFNNSITVASMLLIFPCVRLDCVSSASKTCLDYVWSVNVFMLSVWAILPAQVSLPSLVKVVSLLHNWIRSLSRALNEDHVDLVCVSVQIWGPGLHFGVLIWVIFWSLFRVPFLGTVLGPTITNKIKSPKTGPKNGTQNKDQNWTQIRRQNAIRGPKFADTQTRTCRDHLHSAVCWAILFNCATNQQLQPKNEGKLGRAKLLKQRAWIHSQAKQNIAKTCFTPPWFWNLILLNLAAASCYFIASLDGRVCCKHPFIGRCKMWNCQCPTPAGCICSNSETL